MTILKTWGGAGLATGTLTTSSAGTGDNAFNTVASGLNISNDGIRTPCIGVTDGTGPAAAVWNITTTASWAVRIYFKAGSNSGTFATAYASANKAVQLDFNSSGKLRLTGTVAGTSSVLWTSTNVPTTGTWYRVGATYNGTTGAWTVAYYTGDGSTAIESGSGTEDTGLSLTSLSVGRVGGTSTGLYVDDIAVSNTATLIGPVQTVTEPTSKSWSGAGLATGTLTTTSAGTGDIHFDTVATGMTIANDGIATPCVGVTDGTGPVFATWNFSSLAAWAVRVYFKVGATQGIITSAYSGTNKAVQLDFNGTGQLRLTGTLAGANSIQWTSNSALTVNTWYRAEATYDSGSGNWQIAYYVGDNAVAIETSSGTEDSGLTLTSISLGRVGGTTSGLFLDDMAVTNAAAFIGPARTVVAPTAKYWSGKGLTTGALTTSSAGTGDTAFDSVSSTLTIANDGVRPPCIGVPDGTGVLDATWNFTALASWAFRFYFKAGANTGTIGTVFAGSSKGAQFDFNASGNLRLTGTVSGANSVRWTSASVLTVGTWYRAEVTYNGTTGAYAVAYYADDNATAIESSSGTQDTGLSLTSVGVGRVGGTTTGLFIDDVGVTNTATFIGPAAVKVPTSTRKIWNGTAWIVCNRSFVVS